MIRTGAAPAGARLTAKAYRAATRRVNELTAMYDAQVRTTAALAAAADAAAAPAARRGQRNAGGGAPNGTRRPGAGGGKPARAAGGAPAPPSPGRGDDGGGSEGSKGPDAHPPAKGHPPEGGTGLRDAAQGGKNTGKSKRGGRRRAGGAALGGQDPGPAPDRARARATRRCWHNGCQELVCVFHLSCRACLRVNPSATVCGECHNLNLPGDTCLTLGCPAPGGRPYDPAKDTALANELHGMTPGKYMSRRPHFAPKPARATAHGAGARGLHAAAERFTIASPDGDPGALFLVAARGARRGHHSADGGAPSGARLPGAGGGTRRGQRSAGGDALYFAHLPDAGARRGQPAASLELDLVTTVMQGLGVNERGATPPAGSLMMVRPVSHHHGGRGVSQRTRTPR